MHAETCVNIIDAYNYKNRKYFNETFSQNLVGHLLMKCNKKNIFIVASHL